MRTWTRVKMTKLLKTSDVAVEQALVMLYRHPLGFRFDHADKGSHYARWVLLGRHLTGLHVPAARGIVLRYVDQLVAIAEARASRVAPQRNEKACG